MSLSSALSVALTGLQVSTAQIQVASNNISNANNSGYTAKSVNLSSIAVGQEAGGVYIAGYNRMTNDALTVSYNNATSDASYYGTQNKYLQQVQSILGSTSSNPPLSDAISQFQSAWTQYASSPEDSSQKAAVVQAGNTLASQLRAASSGVLALNRQVISDTGTTVTSLNTYLQQIQTLNQQIATAGTTSAATGDLEDARDQAINQVASIVNVTVVPRADGQIALYTPQGTQLVDGPAQQFTFNGSTVTNANGLDVTNALKGGSLQAELNFIYNGSPAAASTSPANEVIRKLNSQLSAIASAFTTTTGSPTTFAAAYNGTSTNAGELSSGFFTASLDSSGNAIPATFGVNSALLDGTSTIKLNSGSAVNTALTGQRAFTADGLSVSGTYSDLITGVLSNFQQAANTVKTQSTTATSQQTYYQQSLSNATGVNVDQQLVTLTTLQNSYAASAHVISTINQMLQTLESVL